MSRGAILLSDLRSDMAKFMLEKGETGSLDSGLFHVLEKAFNAGMCVERPTPEAIVTHIETYSLDELRLMAGHIHQELNTKIERASIARLTGGVDK